MVKLLNDQTGEGTKDHGCHEHRGSFHGHDRSDRDKSSQDAASVAANHLAARVGDKDRQQAVENRRDQLGQPLIRRPPRRQEEGGDQSESDECSNVRDDHSCKKCPEFLQLLRNRCLLPDRCGFNRCAASHFNYLRVRRPVKTPESCLNDFFSCAFRPLLQAGPVCGFSAFCRDLFAAVSCFF